MNDTLPRRLGPLPGLALCGLTLTLGGPAPAVPAVPSAPATAQALPTYLAADEVQPPAPDGGPPTPGTVRYDFGARSAASAAPIEHTFLLRNAGHAPLTVDHIQPSCGCTTALADGGAEGGAPTVIAPGGQLRVRVAVDPGHLSPGQVTKSVWVFLRDQAGPAATLLVTGTVRPAATFSPAVLNFGQVKAGGTPSQTVTVTLDPALASAGKAPQLVSSDSSVVVTPSPATAGAGSWAYTVSLSPRMHLGVLNGLLSLVGGGGSTASGPSPAIPIVGTVVGDVTASPASVAFGTVAAGQAATQQVSLTGTAPASLSGLTVRAVGPYVTARLRPSPSSGVSGGAHVLEVSVSPKTPAGSVQTQVIVRTARGQELVLPVFAYIAKAGGDQ